MRITRDIIVVAICTVRSVITPRNPQWVVRSDQRTSVQVRSRSRQRKVRRVVVGIQDLVPLMLRWRASLSSLTRSMRERGERVEGRVGVVHVRGAMWFSDAVLLEIRRHRRVRVLGRHALLGVWLQPPALVVIYQP